MNKLTVGQKVWAGHRGGEEWVTITRVGRKYAYFDNGDGGQSVIKMADGKMPVDFWGRGTWSGRAYLSPEHMKECEAKEKLERDTAVAFGELRKAIPYSRPAHLTLEQIKVMQAMLVPPQAAQTREGDK